MAATINPSENGALLGFTGAKFGRDAVPSLLIACDSTSGNPYPLVRDPVSKGLAVADAPGNALLTTVQATLMVIAGYLLTLSTAQRTPQNVRKFKQTLAGDAKEIVPASTDGVGKTVVNASCKGGVPGFDMWAGGSDVGDNDGQYLPPGSALSFSGRESIWVWGTGLVTAAEEY